MGDLAGHERRGSWTWPGRSAVLGLVGAALGIRRDGDFSALEALRVAVAVFESGGALRDYHTVQTVPTARARRPQSRPEALRAAGDGVNNTITLRDYRTCPLYGVALSGEGLVSIAEALRRPVFTLYLGRKACTLSAPLAPVLVQVPDAAQALAQVRVPPWWAEAAPLARVLYADLEPDERAGFSETRHDRALDRARWHFAERRYARHTVEIRPALEASP